MNGNDSDNSDERCGDDCRMSAPRPGKRFDAPVTDIRRKPGPAPSELPSQSKAATRPHRTCQTIGGKGRQLMQGDTIEGNLPHCSLTDEIIEQIVARVRAGNFLRPSAKALGVSLATFNTWIDTGRKHLDEIENGRRTEETQQSKLVRAIDKAEGEFFVEQNGKILAEGGDVKDRELRWKVFQRRFAREWATPAHGIDDATGEKTEVDLTSLLVERLTQAFGIKEDEGDAE